MSSLGRRKWNENTTMTPNSQNNRKNKVSKISRIKSDIKKMS